MPAFHRLDGIELNIAFALPVKLPLLEGLPGALKSRNGLPFCSNKIIDTWTCASELLFRR